MAKILSRDTRTSTSRFPSYAKQGFIGSLFLTALMWLLYVLYIRRLPPEIPLWYSLPYGSGLLAKRDMLLLLPGLATLFTIINLLLTGWWKSIHESFTTLMSWTTLLLSGLLLTALIHIISLMI